MSEHPIIHSIEGFELLEVLGQGGSGIVYLAERQAEQPGLQYAIKVHSSLWSSGVESGTRFEREMAILRTLKHRGIVSIVGQGITSDDPPARYLVMDYVQGALLTYHNKASSVIEKVLLMESVVEALVYAHSCEIRHRDIKPGNVLVRESDAQPIIVDFGHAYMWQEADDEMLTREALGSSGYVPPEVYDNPRGRHPTHDVYSCSVVLYEIIAGHRPSKEKYRPLVELESKALGLDQIVLKGTGSASDRYQSCRELLQALQQWRKRAESTSQFEASDLIEILGQRIVEEKVAHHSREEMQRERKEIEIQAVNPVLVRIQEIAETNMRAVVPALVNAGENVEFVEHQVAMPLQDKNEIVPQYEIVHRDGWSVIFGMSFNYKNPLHQRAGAKPIIDFQDERKISGRKTVSPPQRTYLPFFVVYIDSKKVPGQRRLVGGIICGLTGMKTAKEPIVVPFGPAHERIGFLRLEKDHEIARYVVKCIGSQFGISL